MSLTPDLEALEKQAYASRWQDGLLDLFIGLGILLVGIFWLTPMAGMGGVAPALLIVFWLPARRLVTERRAGYVEFGPERKARERRGLIGLLAMGVLSLLLGIAAFVILNRSGLATGEWIEMGVPALPGVLLGIGAVAGGLMLGVPRILGYGVLMALLAALATALGLEPGVYMAFTGALITSVGVVLLARFFRDHPRPEEAAG